MLARWASLLTLSIVPTSVCTLQIAQKGSLVSLTIARVQYAGGKQHR